MADYDSDSSGAENIATNVLLGYASKEPTLDYFSQLGGHPTWLDADTPPDAALARCKVCNGLMNLLLQLYADTPEFFPGYERRLYIWACKRKLCRRKAGSVRGFRSVRYIAPPAFSTASSSRPAATEVSSTPKSAVNLGETLFGVKSHANVQADPFAASSSPFTSPSATAPTSSQKPVEAASFAETFAQKARITSPSSSASVKAVAKSEDWPPPSSFPEPYPAYYIDADKEYLEPDSQAVPANARLDGEAGSNSSAADEKAAFESSMDRTFQRFADRLAQNPEQALRYEFRGQPLLYSTKDAVGKLLDPAQGQSNKKVQTTSGSHSRLPRCENCGASRVFELQLTPHTIMELEADDMSIEGMDWGTIIFGSCSADCLQRGKEDEVGYVEEWVGVQWEELTSKGH
ncbi:hypothetical protein LTR53_002113 [Teratosphaeriaceae sp. CCFEE 6253]|nr:hypothetical protein LTR53_002113 [Teratosphaeriaceae sp. CCFEE 6253]